MTHQCVALYEIEQAGARWDSATEDVTGPSGLIMRAVLGAMAEIDRTKTVANLARGKRAKAAAGRPIGQGKPSYGLDWQRDAEGRTSAGSKTPRRSRTSAASSATTMPG